MDFDKVINLMDFGNEINFMDFDKVIFDKVNNTH